MQISLLTKSHLPWLVLILPVTSVLVSIALLADWSRAVVNTTKDEETQNNNCSLSEAIRAANTERPVGACPPGRGTDQVLLPEG